MLLNAVQGVLSILLLLGVGYFLSYKGWFNDNSQKLLSKLVTGLSLPAYMISNLMGTYDRNGLLHLANGLFVPFASIIICYVAGVLVAKAIKVPPGRFGVFCSIFGLSNTIFVGLPVNMALFGEQSVPFVLLYYIGNTTLFWTIGTFAIRRDGEIKGAKGTGTANGADIPEAFKESKGSKVSKISKLSKVSKVFSLDNIKHIFSPPLTAFLLAIILILLEIKLPKTIMDTCKYLGNMTTPLAVLFTGSVMYSVNLKKIRLNLEMAVLLIGRFIIAPAIVAVICIKLPLPVLMKQVFVIQAAMPAMTQTSIIARAYGADHEYAAVMTTITTVISLLMIPIYMLLINSGVF